MTNQNCVDNTELNVAVAEAVNKRKLVTIRTIAALEPIEGADVIEVAVVEGWRLVVKRGEFKVGDLCLYFEIDSFLPDGVAAWQFLVDKSSREFNGVKGHKLRTIKLRGQVSQGLALPLSAELLEHFAIYENVANRCHPVWIENITDNGCYIEPQNIDQLREIDLSVTLGIEKYEAPLPAELVGQAAGLFPSFIKKTDQERIQNLGAEVFGYEKTVRRASEWIDITVAQPKDGAFVMCKNALGEEWVEEHWDVDEPLGATTHWSAMAVYPPKASPDDVYEVTIKLDGSSMTAFYRDGEVGVCSRNLQLKTDDCNKDNTFVRMFYDSGLWYTLPLLAASYGNIALQGELMGPNIQGNREGFTDFKFFVFDVFFIDKARYATPDERVEIMNKLYDVGTVPQKVLHVPVLDCYVKLGELGLHNIGDVLKYAEGPSINHPVREGLVFKRMDGQFSFKAISNLFLTKEKD
jgi:RNA ligase